MWQDKMTSINDTVEDREKINQGGLMRRIESPSRKMMIAGSLFTLFTAGSHFCGLTSNAYAGDAYTKKARELADGKKKEGKPEYPSLPQEAQKYLKDKDYDSLGDFVKRYPKYTKKVREAVEGMKEGAGGFRDKVLELVGDAAEDVANSGPGQSVYRAFLNDAGKLGPRQKGNLPGYDPRPPPSDF